MADQEREPVARLYGAGDIRVADEHVPAPAPGRAWCASRRWESADRTCTGSRRAASATRRSASPLVVGHEFAGVVEGGPLDGRRVAVDPALHCGHCDRCLAGDQNLCPNVVFAGHGELRRRAAALPELADRGAAPAPRLHGRRRRRDARAARRGDPRARPRPRAPRRGRRRRRVRADRAADDPGRAGRGRARRARRRSAAAPARGGRAGRRRAGRSRRRTSPTRWGWTSRSRSRAPTPRSTPRCRSRARAPASCWSGSPPTTAPPSAPRSPAARA